jgi:hypothetical protein
MRYTDAPDISPVWTIVARLSGDIPPGGFVAGNSPLPFRHGIGQASIQNRRPKPIRD